MKKISILGFTIALLIVFLSPMAQAYRGWLSNEQYSRGPVLGGGTTSSFIDGITEQHEHGKFMGYKVSCKLYCRECDCYTPAVVKRVFPRPTPVYQANVEANCKKCGRHILESLTW
ncbi:hypothetical protein IJT17_09315 [bacterium]|nr:hypothetical protein [bacterium]